MSELREHPWERSLRERAERYRGKAAGAEPLPLHPTKSRLELLTAVAAGEVSRGIFDDLLDGRRVNHRIDELERVGWIAVADGATALNGTALVWSLTDAGRKVLLEAP